MRKLPRILMFCCILTLFLIFPVKADTGNGLTFNVTKTAAPSTAGTSSSVSFAITIENISESNAAPVRVTDTLPDGWVYNNDAKLTDLASTTTDFTPSVVGQMLTWVFEGSNLQSIPNNQNIVISFTAKAPETEGTYTNKACLEEPEQVCANADVEVKKSTPQTGIVENIIVMVFISLSLILISQMLRKNRKSFEDKLLSKYDRIK